MKYVTIFFLLFAMAINVSYAEPVIVNGSCFNREINIFNSRYVFSPLAKKFCSSLSTEFKWTYGNVIDQGMGLITNKALSCREMDRKTGKLSAALTDACRTMPTKFVRYGDGFVTWFYNGMGCYEVDSETEGRKYKNIALEVSCEEALGLDDSDRSNNNKQKNQLKKSSQPQTHSGAPR